MLKGFLGRDKESQNKRSNLRVPMNISLCVQLLHGYDNPGQPIKGGKCFVIRTVDISSGGMCIIHRGMLFSGEHLLIRSKNTLLEPFPQACMGCIKKDELHDMPLTEPVIAKVTWRTGTKCGLRFLSWHPADSDVIHKVAWTEHISQVRKDAEYREHILMERMKRAEESKE